MKRFWHFIIRWLFPGTLDEYYAAREIHRREERIYRRQPQFIIGAALFVVPLLVLVSSDILPGAWKFLLLPVIFGFVCLRDTVSEHYCLLLLRQARHAQSGGSHIPADQPKVASGWEATRMQGKWKFILQNGVLFWGGFMFIVTTATEGASHRPVTAVSILVRVCIWIIFGALFGWVTWSTSERRYQKSLQHGAPKA